MPPQSSGLISSSQTDSLEQQRLNSLVNSMADAVIAVDENAGIVLYNAAALNILNVNNMNVGSPLAAIFKPIDKDSQTQDITAMVKAAQTPMTTRDLRLGYSDGSIINIYLSIAPVRLGYGETGQGGYVLLLRDITREKSLEEERDEFISVVSHELWTPVTIAEGNISNAQVMASQDHDPEPIQQALHDAHNQVLFLADMINDLSTLSRAERGTLKLELESIDVKELVSELRNNYRPEAENKGLVFDIVVDPNTGLLHSSKLYLHEILQNFITNAIKYSPSGQIKVHAEPAAVGVRISVQDNGIGISKADQARVFDKFFRSEDYRTRQANGTGLGLYVTMKLAKLIHAEISLQSELNHGSTFTIFVPNL